MRNNLHVFDLWKETSNVANLSATSLLAVLIAARRPHVTIISFAYQDVWQLAVGEMFINVKQKKSKEKLFYS